TITRNGYAFVALEGVEAGTVADVFIPAQFVRTALTGDRVKITITDPHNSKGPSGQVVTVLERNKDLFVGQVISIDNRSCKATVKPISNAFIKPLEIAMTFALQQEDWVEFSIASTLADAFEFNAELTTVLHTENSVSGILDGITQEFELPKLYTASEEDAAAALSLREIPRRDLTNWVTMTIDPIDAKDFDDALTMVSEDEKSFTVGIHIADVAAYVAPDELFDQMASTRCFTNYLPGRMIPMLPKKLLAERCSLNANEVKPAHTIVVVIDKSDGHVISSERFHSWIKVCKRLHYEEVQDFLDDNKFTFHAKEEAEASTLKAVEEYAHDWPTWPDFVQNSIKDLFKVYKLVRERRKKLEHYIEVVPKEIRILCGGNPPGIKGLRTEKADESHEIVEEFMLLGNTLVALEMDKNKIPAVYRTHPAPAQDSILAFSRWIKETLHQDTGSLNDREKINELLKGFDPSDPYFEVIMVSFVRALERAKYESSPQLHYGLGKDHYLHFTSPIRRYSDLFVHQQLWAKELGQKIRSEQEAAMIASVITSTEQRYDEAYWTANDRLKLYFIAGKIASGELVKIKAVIMAFTKYDISLYLPELGMFSSIPYSVLNGYHEPNEDGSILRSNGKDIYEKGQIINVSVSNVNPLLGELTFVPVK
ncbi:MAG: RNB domain-containing ribonuclease, partial [Lentisphaeria bacterium]